MKHIKKFNEKYLINEGLVNTNEISSKIKNEIGIVIRNLMNDICENIRDKRLNIDKTRKSYKDFFDSMAVLEKKYPGAVTTKDVYDLCYEYENKLSYKLNELNDDEDIKMKSSAEK